VLLMDAGHQKDFAYRSRLNEHEHERNRVK
jgi:hypothetical protein